MAKRGSKRDRDSGSILSIPSNRPSGHRRAIRGETDRIRDSIGEIGVAHRAWKHPRQSCRSIRQAQQPRGMFSS